MNVPAKKSAPPKKYFKVNFFLYLNKSAMQNPPIIAGIIKANALIAPADAASEPVPVSWTTAAVITKSAWYVINTRIDDNAITIKTGEKNTILS